MLYNMCQREVSVSLQLCSGFYVPIISVPSSFDGIHVMCLWTKRENPQKHSICTEKLKVRPE